MKQPQTTAGFKLVAGGRPATPEEPAPPPHDAPIELEHGTFWPIDQRFVMPLKHTGMGNIAVAFCDQPTALEIDRILSTRPYNQVMAEDFSEVRRRLADCASAYSLAGSRKQFSQLGLYTGHSSKEGSANWYESATFDPRLAGVFATLALARAADEPGATKVSRYALWSVCKERRRCGLHLKSDNKQGTVIEAPSLPIEIAQDWQILVLGSAAMRETAAA